MTELYLRRLDRVVVPILLILALLLLYRGHNDPGGGFIAGLVTAAAFQLLVLSRGEAECRARIGPWLRPTIGLGLTIAVASALLGITAGPIFTGLWWESSVAGVDLKFGTPQLFDVGVFLVVSAVVSSLLLGLSGDDDKRRAEAERNASADSNTSEVGA
ncbi:MAG: MnhB domain-containing protein [Actinomycetota bacterium]